MAKIFYTERDIDDMKARGVTTLDITDNMVITDLALERAMKYDMKINRAERGAAPMASFSPSVNLSVSSVHTMASRSSSDSELKERIRTAVLAKLGGQVDMTLLDAVISRVISSIK